MSTAIHFRMEPSANDLLPAKAHPDDAAWDLRARTGQELQPGKIALVPTGVFLELPVGYEAQVRPRSGLALKSGVTVWNSPGTIDAGYRGEIGVILYNGSDTTFAIHRGDRIAQMVIHKLPDVTLELADELNDSARGTGGFGSTGIQ